MSTTLRDFRNFTLFTDAIINGEKCTCNKNPVLLSSNIDMYDHTGGIWVPHHEVKQWVYVTCELCQYQWSHEKILNRIERREKNG